MIFYRITFVCFLAAVCGAVPISPRVSDEHNIDECPNQTLAVTALLESNIYEAAAILEVKRTITYPETGLNSKQITCVKITNLDTADHGGYPKVVSGGVGSYAIEILLTSQWSQPLNFRVEVWGAA